MHLRRKMRNEKQKPRHFEIMPPTGVLMPGQRLNVQVKFMPTEEVCQMNFSSLWTLYCKKETQQLYAFRIKPLLQPNCMHGVWLYKIMNNAKNNNGLNALFLGTIIKNYIEVTNTILGIRVSNKMDQLFYVNFHSQFEI